MGYKTWKEDNENYELDPVAVKKNKKLKEQRKDKFYKKIFNWFFSLKDKLFKELICNWAITISSLTIAIISLVGTKDMDQSDASLEAAGVKFFVVMIMVLVFISSVIYKGILRYKMKKGLYWPKYKKKTRDK